MFAENASPYILLKQLKKNCCDMNIGEIFCLVTFFLFSDSGFNLFSGFDFYFDIFWTAWQWKPATLAPEFPNVNIRVNTDTSSSIFANNGPLEFTTNPIYSPDWGFFFRTLDPSIRVSMVLSQTDFFLQRYCHATLRLWSTAVANKPLTKAPSYWARYNLTFT